MASTTAATTTPPPETNAGTVTSWIPITTAWPSQSGCAEALMDIRGVILAWEPQYGISVNTNLDCLPPAATNWALQSDLGSNGNTISSLGPMVCPEAYYTVTTSIKDQDSTFAAYCPSGYSVNILGSSPLDEAIAPSRDVLCSSMVVTDQTVTVASPIVTLEEATWSYVSTIAAQIFAPALAGWILADSTPTTQTMIATAATTSIKSIPSASPVSSKSAGLSTGAKAGIGVAVAFAAIVFCIFCLTFVVSRRRRRKSSGAAAAMENKSYMVPFELQGSHRGAHEVDTHEKPQEMSHSPNDSSVIELE